MKTQEFIIQGMHCASCVKLNEDAISNLVWVESVSINFSLNKATVLYDENILSEKNIIKAVQKAWYNAKIFDKQEFLEISESTLKKYFLDFVLSFILTLPIFFTMFFELKIWIKFVDIDLMMRSHLLFSLVVVYGFWRRFHKNFLLNVIKFQFNMDSLISIWTSAAFWLSVWNMFFMQPVYFEAASAIIVFVNLWKWLENKSKSWTMEAMKWLIEMSVKKSSLLVEWKEYLVDTESILVWDILIVKPWEKIPLDWEIIFWESNIDESMLTWESHPVFKKIGEKVFWSTFNIDWVLHIKVSSVWEDTVFAQIVKLVSDAQSHKASIQKLVDKISWYFVPIVILISILTLIWWYIYSWNLWSSIIYAVCVLVIACPCSLGLATPTAVMVGTWLAAKHWILIKSPEIFEKSKKIDVVVFDKTWTLSVWKPSVTELRVIYEDAEFFEKLVYSLSSMSNHPLSRAISNYFDWVEKVEIADFKEISWKWISWKYWDKIILIWNIKLMNEFNIKLDKNQFIDLEEKWLSVNFIAIDGNLSWLIWLFDEPKKMSEYTVNQLKSKWIKTVILSWDSMNSVESMWKRLWVDEFYAQMLPWDKSDKIKQLQQSWNLVAFVWDWINDAPSLAQADIWIAMADASDIALQTWDIILLWWKIEQVLLAINISKITFKTIRQNLFWAFVYNAIWIPVAAFGFLNPEIASFAMAMSSVSVVVNSLIIKMKNYS